MTPETIAAVVAELQTRGIEVYKEHPGYIATYLRDENYTRIHWNDLDETLAGNVMSADGALFAGNIESEIRANSTDVQAIADFIAKHSAPIPYYNQFRDIPIPYFLRGPGWDDRSWHNDVCPHSDYTPDIEAGDCLRVWVGPEQREDREHPTQARYCVEYVADAASCEGNLLYTGDDPAAVEDVIAKFRAERR